MPSRRRRKSSKAVLLRQRVRFPYVHDLDRLLSLLVAHGHSVPDEVREADRLTDYAVLTRYRIAAEPVTAAERRTAVQIAETVRWAEQIIAPPSEP
jgi:HEPN domain-containing protein